MRVGVCVSVCMNKYCGHISLTHTRTHTHTHTHTHTVAGQRDVQFGRDRQSVENGGNGGSTCGLVTEMTT